MIKNASNKKRYVRITAGNIRNNHIYITGHHDFFPKDCIGASSRSKEKQDCSISIYLDGLNKTIKTDIAKDAKTGKPRRMFRDRKWVKDFFQFNEIKPGDILQLDRLAERNYRLSQASHNGESIDYSFAEFFAGIGLVRMGLEAQGWSITFANDIDPQKKEMYDGHFHNTSEHFNTTDIHLLNPQEVPTVTLATASFPCTDLSLAGGRKGLRGKQSSAFFGLVKVLAGMENRRPKLLLLENVPGFLTSHNGRDFHEAMLELNKLGYSIDPFILDARWFTPQSRPRLFVVGILGEDVESKQFALCSRIRPPMIIDYISAHQDIRWRIADLPDPPESSSKKLKDILEKLDGNAPEWWQPERAEYLYNQMSEKHKNIADAWMTKNCWSYGTVFRRVRMQSNGVKRSMGELRCDGIAGCLRTPKGGSGRQILFKAGYGKYAARLLTPRECARLMGADEFKITAPLNQALFGFGDAVCVPAISWIAKQYLNPIIESSVTQNKEKDLVVV